MESIKIVNEEIKNLEVFRYKTIKKFTELVDGDKMNYDLYGDGINSELEKYLKSIQGMGSKLQALYKVKNQLEKKGE